MEDTYKGQVDNPLSLNRYTYVLNNPLIFIDPTGHAEVSFRAIWFGMTKAGNELPGAVEKAGKELPGAVKKAGVEYVGEENVNTLSDGNWNSDDVFAAGSVAINIVPVGKALKTAKTGTKTAAKALQKCNCFTAGTKVLTDEGEKPIEEIDVGDKVLAKSDETGEVAYKEVVGLFQKQADEIYYVQIGDEIIEVTGEHPFWLDGKGWTFVKDLKVGDLLVSSDGSKLAIDKIEKEPREATVYNFEVEDFSSYFVSNLGIWVHNCASNPSAQQLLGIKFAGNLRSTLNEKIPRDISLPKGSTRHLTSSEKATANQHINDLMALKYGDTSTAQRLNNYRPHLRNDGWWSLDLSTQNGASNVMRLLYREVNGAIEWKVIQNH
ncbi:hypothetical protein B5G50_19390 [Brevibacillus brevis]|uniref:polymorphic toxin-type HINT domain-containing protein n=1 Tax=Brevibacillus brevis TaxID=1393 RepID=UPI000B3AC518|nr:polymorphic toxin-type HINT domain-containing protein [Brevibacillus brevis]OUQ86855.1 hypothetical protein B5G50_19390 [Brevibacillus brevis]